MVFLDGIGTSEIVLILSIFGMLLLLPLITLIDVIRSEFQGPNDKLIWVLIILFLNIIGAILYLAIGRNQRVA